MADGRGWSPLYSAFISYSHRDEAFVRRLHRRLEGYRLPARIAGRADVRGDGSRRLKPIFRDRDELAAAADLPDAVTAALHASRRLIVICSPEAARSAWVGREIAAFRAMHGEDAILTALIRGEADEAFHPELLRAGEDGAEAQPLAADFRSRGDGPRLAFLKLVAALADVGLDAVVQRDAQRRLRQVTAIAAASLAGAVGATALAVYALQARNAAIAERERSERVIEFLLTDLRARLKGVGRLDLLTAVNQGALRYYRGQNLARLTPAALQQRAKLLQALGEDEMRRDNLPAARAEFEEARRTTAAILQARPTDPARIFAHAQSEFWVGFAALRSGDDAAAERAFEGYADLAGRLAGSPNPDWRLEQGYADSNLGVIELRKPDARRAEALFTQALAVYGPIARLRPDDGPLQAEIANAHAWLADARRLVGDFDGALAHRAEQTRILQALLAKDPRDHEIRGYLVAATLGRARVAAARGDARGALALLAEGRTAARALSAEDPQDVDLARQARIFDLFEAQTRLAAPAHLGLAGAPVDDLIGDCAADRRQRDNDELAGFCDVLRARRLAATGRGDEAAALAAAVRKRIGGRRLRLTEHWLLNFDEELSLIPTSDHTLSAARGRT